MKVLGIEKVDYVNKAGKHILGTKLHMGYEKETCNGVCVLSEYLKECPDVQIGDEVELRYNKFGQAVDVLIMDV